MSERPTKTVNGIKVIGVINPAVDSCFVLLRGQRTYCADYDRVSCRCPFKSEAWAPRGLWLTENQALPLLLTGDVK